MTAAEWEGKAGVGGGRSGIYIFLLFPLPQCPLTSPPPFFPSFCYLDFFSYCVMSIIYAKSFAACCTALASRRGRAGKGGDRGARNQGWGRGGDPQPLPALGGPVGSLPPQEWKVGAAGHAAPSEMPFEVFILEGARVGAGARKSGLRTLCHTPFSLGLDGNSGDSQQPHSPL